MTITALPTPPLRSDPTSFATRADAFLAALPTFADEANALAVAMNLNSTTDTSSSGVTIGTGSKTLTVSAGKSFQPGMYLVVADTAAPSTNSMWGQITSYSGTTLVVQVLAVRGSGAIASWVLSQSAPGGAAAGGNADITSLTALQSINGGSIGGLRNKAINGDFSVNQLAVSGTVTLAANAFGHDMWFAGASGCTYTFATVANVTTVTITAGSLKQVVEGVFLETGSHALSWVGTAQGKIGAGSFGVSGITGSVTGGTNTVLEFGIGTLTKVQFEAGIATVFDKRLPPIELALCQRYVYKTYNSAIAPGAVTGVGALASYCPAPCNYFSLPVQFPVPMRDTPSVTIYGADGFAGRFTVDASWVAAVVSSSGQRGATISASNQAISTNQFVSCHVVAASRLTA